MMGPEAEEGCLQHDIGCWRGRMLLIHLFCKDISILLLANEFGAAHA